MRVYRTIQKRYPIIRIPTLHSLGNIKVEYVYKILLSGTILTYDNSAIFEIVLCAVRCATTRYSFTYPPSLPVLSRPPLERELTMDHCCPCRLPNHRRSHVTRSRFDHDFGLLIQCSDSRVHWHRSCTRSGWEQ